MMSAAERPAEHPSLDEPLPAEVLRRVSTGFVAYRNYPVFSWPWLKKRTALFALATVSFGVLVGLGTYGARQQVGPAIGVTAQFVVAFLLMTSLGPALATLVRHQRMALRREQIWVVAALLVGVYASFRADEWASRGIGERTQVDFEGRTLNGQLPNPEMGAAALTVNLVVLVVIYGLLGGGLAVRVYLAEPGRLRELARERELSALRTEKQNMDVRLGVLQAQVEPHFLFNTLASIRSLVATQPARAEASIEALVDYLRATIPRLRADSTRVDSTLGQQLEICTSYLALVDVRMGERLHHEIDVAAPLRAIEFPPLLLITLVENAVKHGLEPKPGPGRIVIGARCAEGRLEVSVRDDGVGLRDELGSGVGLANVREQLRARYGAQATLSLTGAPGQGAVATIVIPVPGQAA
jgi:signal transduction histidine kinase